MLCYTRRYLYLDYKHWINLLIPIHVKLIIIIIDPFMFLSHSSVLVVLLKAYN
ncbi:hypothetical protein Hanom_Chr16g01441161 [Helianthus anomalus]